MERWLNRYSSIDDPKALEDIRKGFQSLADLSEKSGLEYDAAIFKNSIVQIDAQLARLRKAAPAHDANPL